MASFDAILGRDEVVLESHPPPPPKKEKIPFLERAFRVIVNEMMRYGIVYYSQEICSQICTDENSNNFDGLGLAT